MTADEYRLFAEIARALENGEQAVLATIISAKGSTPREVGAKMVVFSDGSTLGTVGGGRGEEEVRRACLRAMETAMPEILGVAFAEEMTLEAEQICGGTIEVLIDPCPLAHQAIFRGLLNAMDQRHPVAAVSLTKPPLGLALLVRGSWEILWDAGLVDRDILPEMVKVAERSLRERTPTLLSMGSEQIFVDVFTPVPTLLIVGAGHIGRSLAQLGRSVGFYVVVVDDRPEVLTPTRAPQADRVIVEDIQAALSKLVYDQETYVALVTRAHRYDYYALQHLLQTDARYIGLIGSQRRVITVLNLLLADGYRPKQLARIYGPIGLDINALTPEEIALSILAEVVKVRRGGQAQSMSIVREALSQRAIREGQDRNG